jgi:hypothetical protein
MDAVAVMMWIVAIMSFWLGAMCRRQDKPADLCAHCGYELEAPTEPRG